MQSIINAMAVEKSVIKKKKRRERRLGKVAVKGGKERAITSANEMK
jgi:hypothetical protein